MRPLVIYDEQYETELVATVAAFLEADGNVAATAQRLFTHRHTIRYRLERVRELCGLDVGSSDGREKLSLGLKAMRVLGIVAAADPEHALEQYAGGFGGRRVEGVPGIHQRARFLPRRGGSEDRNQQAGTPRRGRPEDLRKAAAR